MFFFEKITLRRPYVGCEVVGARVVREDPHNRVLLAQGPQEVLEKGGGLWTENSMEVQRFFFKKNQTCCIC